MEKTLKDLASDALFVQNACNLSGIVHSFSRALSRLRELEPEQGTEYYNRHPIAVLFCSKISQLTGYESDEMARFTAAYDWAVEQAGGDPLK